METEYFFSLIFSVLFSTGKLSGTLVNIIVLLFKRTACQSRSQSYWTVLRSQSVYLTKSWEARLESSVWIQQKMIVWSCVRYNLFECLREFVLFFLFCTITGYPLASLHQELLRSPFSANGCLFPEVDVPLKSGILLWSSQTTQPPFIIMLKS